MDTTMKRLGWAAAFSAALLWMAAPGCSDDNAPAAGQTQADVDVWNDADGQRDAGDSEGDDASADSDSLNDAEDATGGETDVADVDPPQDAAEDAPSDAEPDVAEDAPPVDAEVDAADVSIDVEADAEPEGIGAQCFGEIFDPEEFGPDYDQFEPEVGTHCAGTNHQAIREVEQVVFFGDSVTQGTPNDMHPLCVDNGHFYRNLLAEWLADRYDLDRGEALDWGAWKSYSCLYDGQPGRMASGDFKNCSKWGARTDDFIGEVGCGGFGEDEARCCEVCCHGGTCDADGRCVRGANPPAEDAFCQQGGKQVFQCLPNGGSDKRTLFVFTMGGNDIAAITQDGSEFTSDTAEGAAEIEAGYPSMWALAESTVAHLEETVKVLKDPARFPNGSFVVFASPFEFTDGTGQTSACSPDSINVPGFGEVDVSDLGLNLAEIGGFGEWERPEVQEEIVVWITEQYMRIAVEHGADMVWMLEAFCGHGYVATGPDADTDNRCYRADDPTRWFDVTCIHPNDAGHEAIFRLFSDVIRE